MRMAIAPFEQALANFSGEMESFSPMSSPIPHVELTIAMTCNGAKPNDTYQVLTPYNT